MRLHGVAADHDSGGGGERAAGGILVDIAGLQLRLLPYDALSRHLLHAAKPIGNMPIARQKPHRLGGMVGNGDLVGPDVSALLRVGMVRQRSEEHTSELQSRENLV